MLIIGLEYGPAKLNDSRDIAEPGIFVANSRIQASRTDCSSYDEFRFKQRLLNHVTITVVKCISLSVMLNACREATARFSSTLKTDGPFTIHKRPNEEASLGRPP